MEFSRGVTEAIPHRQPFIMVDRVIEIVPGKKAVAIKKITHNDPLSTGWGCGKYYPEAFVLEAMAQVGALAAARPVEPQKGSPAESGGGPLSGFLAAINGATFLKRPEIGDNILFELQFEARMGALVRFRATALIEGEMAAESVLTFSVPG